ncbi:YcjF family protein [Maritalea sp.]|jgi:putative membrane protein|uniref:YcjF family protein n=1 Tax=Maritalea sp. TaxID=2003361 RepID=UPI0039E4599A
MKKPVAIEINAEPNKPSVTPTKIDGSKSPLAFDIALAQIEEPNFNADLELAEDIVLPKRSIWSKLFWAALAFLVSLGSALALERLVSDLFARYPALGWIGLAAVALLLLALFALIIRELFGMMRLRKLEHLRIAASDAHQNHQLKPAKSIASNIRQLYAERADCARSVANYDKGADGIFDADHVLPFAERELQHPLDKKARIMIAASAWRIALVTSVSPRALFDIAFVLYESIRLSRRVATLYGARPGFFGFMTLSKAILGHLALTGGIALGDSVLQQLLGHGIAARVSTKLGEGVINGLMTVRVGIAAIRVTRPMPFLNAKAPNVSEFLPELLKLAKDDPKS